ncbi:hypothetical protein BC835DRAFT_655410 [Cytidiella melzeri]|nr:hypothetical protein BC835DRAFT_655410 [Cytidiella melzeri]
MTHQPFKKRKVQRSTKKRGEEDDEAAEYEKMRAQIAKEVSMVILLLKSTHADCTNADHQVKPKHSSRTKDERTKDIRAIFKPGHRESRDGVSVPGHWCKVCRSLNVKSDHSFFTGSGSTLRAHISRHWKTHGAIYEDGCKKAGVEPHKRAMPLKMQGNNICTSNGKCHGWPD